MGVTFYTIGEVTTPGIIARSGRHVYEGGIAVSQDLWNKEVKFGDIIFVQSTGKYYTCEDTMHEKYKNRVDIYTNDKTLAKSGSSRSNIVILRQPR
jgi:3D (Asp-Asp-Asp) domain-containing protein